jgi:hypothetical protein
MLVLKAERNIWTRVQHGGAVMRVKVDMKPGLPGGRDEPYLIFDLPSQDFQVVRENAVVQEP